MITDHEAMCAAAYIGIRPWFTYPGCMEWEAKARHIADQSMGCVLATGGTQLQARQAWDEAFAKARGLA